MKDPVTIVSLLTRIHHDFPGASVTRIEGGAWQALIKQAPKTEWAIVRHDLADLEQRLEDLDLPASRTKECM